MNKKFIYLAIFLTAVFIIFYFASETQENKISCTEEAKVCHDGSSVGRTFPDCNFAPCPGEEEGILISLPKNNEEIKSPLKIKGEARGFWFFEAEFIVLLFDINNNFLGEAILTAQDDWMTENFVPFEGEMVFSKPLLKTTGPAIGILRFLSANPSGLPEHQRVFEVFIFFES